MTGPLGRRGAETDAAGSARGSISRMIWSTKRRGTTVHDLPLRLGASVVNCFLETI